MQTLNDKTNIPIVLGCVYKNPGIFKSGRGAVYNTEYIAPTITSMSGGGNKPTIIVKKIVKENKNE